MKYAYRPHGTCSQLIELSISDADDTIENVFFYGGCNGNLQALSRLVKGMKADEAIGKLEGIRCGYKMTSCPDQLAKALRERKRIG